MTTMPDKAKVTLDQVIGSNLRRFREETGLSQDAVSRRLRNYGLPWSRSTVAALEAGTKTMDVLELALLSHALGRPPEYWLAGEGLVDTKLGTVTVSAVRLSFSGKDAWSTIDPTIEFNNPAVRYGIREIPDLWGAQAESDRTFARYERIIPRVTRSQLGAAEDAIKGEAERKAAHKLSVDNPIELALAAIALWGRSLTEERDARLDREASSDASARALQALRGHVTRRLLEEIEPVVRKADH